MKCKMNSIFLLCGLCHMFRYSVLFLFTSIFSTLNCIWNPKNRQKQKDIVQFKKLKSYNIICTMCIIVLWGTFLVHSFLATFFFWNKNKSTFADVKSVCVCMCVCAGFYFRNQKHQVMPQQHEITVLISFQKPEKYNRKKTM